jgi:hypothetical protein
MALCEVFVNGAALPKADLLEVTVDEDVSVPSLFILRS